MIGAADAHVFLGDFGEPLTVGAITVPAIRAIRNVWAKDGDYRVEEQSLVAMVATAALPAGTERDAECTFAGVSYRIRHVAPPPEHPDGAFTDVHLVER